MNKEHLSARCDYFDMVHGVTVRAIRVLSDDELDFRPRPNMRTPRELIFHIYSQEKLLAEAARGGRFTSDMAKASSPSDDQIASLVEAPFGTFPAWAYFMFANDEHWHHRGQFYSYLRLLGKEPPMLYDYEAGDA